MKLADGNGYIDIIFYIIVGILILAANAYRSYTKSKEQKDRQPGEAMPGFPRVDYEPEFEYEKPVYEKIPVPEREEVFLDEPVPFPNTDPILDETVSAVEVNQIDKPVEEGQAAFKNTLETVLADIRTYSEADIQEFDLTKGFFPSEETDEEKSITEKEAFDLQKAVIYSEILHPKYISNRY